MAKKSMLQKAVTLVAWLTGVIVSLAVGFAMVNNGPLSQIPYISSGIIGVFGWIVIIATLLGVVLAIIDAIK